MSDLFLFGAFPYLATALAVAGLAQRYRSFRSTVGTRSTQLLESRLLYWGSLPWHPAILAILAAHLAAAVAPGPVGRLLGSPLRLQVLEVSGMALGALAVVGIAVLLVRRFAVTCATTPMDWVVLSLLLLQAATGLFIAYALRWGSVWYLHTAAPWLASLARLSPEVDRMAALPPVVKVHALNAFLLLALVPFSRLVHVTRFPLSYLWRPPQVVIWNRPPVAGHPRSGSATRP